MNATLSTTTPIGGRSSIPKPRQCAKPSPAQVTMQRVPSEAEEYRRIQGTIWYSTLGGSF